VTNLALTIDTTAIGGPSNVPMLDDGLNGDAVAGDGIFSYRPTVYSTTTASFNFPITATATGATNGAAAVAIGVYTIANDVPTGSIIVTRGQNGPFDNTNALSSNHTGFSTPCSPSIGFRDLFFIYTPTCTGTATFSTCGGDAVNLPGELGDSQITVHDMSLTVLGCNDDAGTTSGLCGPNGWQSTVENIAVTAGVNYLVRVAGYGSSDIGSFYLNISESSAVATTFGTSCGAFPIALAGLPPRLGQIGTLSVSGARPNAAGILAFGGVPSVPGAIGVCPLYIDVAGPTFVVNTFASDATGSWSYTDTLPSDPSIACLTIAVQAATLHPDGFESSNGLQPTFGY
jgi:hypothetical protein